MINNEFFNTVRFARRLRELKIDRQDKLMRNIAFIGYMAGRRDLHNEQSAEYLDGIEELRKCAACGAERSWE